MIRYLMRQLLFAAVALALATVAFILLDLAVYGHVNW